MRALDHRLPGQGRSQGGGAKRVCASLGFSGTRGSMAREAGLCSTHFFRADSTLTHMTIQVTQL